MDDIQKGIAHQDIAQWARSASVEQLRSQSASLAPEQAAIAISALQPDQDPLWAQKARALIEGLRENSQRERAAAALTLPQLLFLLDGDKEAVTFPLAPFFVGLPSALFAQLMENASAPLLALLRVESTCEPLQHHLTLLCHSVAAESEQLSHAVIALGVAIDQLDVMQQGKEEIKRLLQQIDLIADSYQKKEKITANALILAWNSARADLIEKLMILKELLARRRKCEVGYPRTIDSAPSGLYAHLEGCLAKVYSQGLEERDSAIEALARLGIWYLRDYWEVGLLPHVLSLQELEELEGSAEKEALYAAARHRLAELGLKEVSDLTKQMICSKKMLQDYLTAAVIPH